MSRSTITEREVIVQSAGVELAGNLTRPDPCVGLVLFAHGSGSSRFSRRRGPPGTGGRRGVPWRPSGPCR